MAWPIWSSGWRRTLDKKLGGARPTRLRDLLELEVGGLRGPVAEGEEELAIEELCGRLVRRGQFLEERGLTTWPDGTVSGSYGFRHALYQEVLYQRLSASRRVRVHKAIGERLENGYGERAQEIAAELAMHFERGQEQEQERAVHYLQQAGENALRRYAYPEALGHFHEGAEFLQTLPPTADRARRELALQFLLIQALIAVKGHASVEVEHAYLYTQTLCEQAGTAQQLFFVLLGLVRLRHGHCEYQHARELSSGAMPLLSVSKILPSSFRPVMP